MDLNNITILYGQALIDIQWDRSITYPINNKKTMMMYYNFTGEKTKCENKEFFH